MVATFRGKPPLPPADRTWDLDQSLWALALLALVVLKLTGVIAWSWWWVMSPLWMSDLVLPFRFNLPGTVARLWNLGARLALPALVVLKLTGVISWPWWWVMSPLWISGVVLVPFLCLLVAGIWWDRRNRRLSGEF